MDQSSLPGLVISDLGNGIALVALDRPEVLNAADVEMHRALSAVWGQIDADPAFRVAVVTGSGRAFSAGGELTMLDEMARDHDALLTQWRDAGRIVDAMLSCSKPIVSAVNGVAVGAGLAVALVADISVVGRGAKLSDGHARIGVAAGDHAALLWPWLCGPAKSKLHLLLGDFLSGEEAERIGLASICVDDDVVLETAIELAGRLATRSASALAFTKRAINGHLLSSASVMGESLALEMLGFTGPDAREGIDALLEKRLPHFPSAAGEWRD